MSATGESRHPRAPNRPSTIATSSGPREKKSRQDVRAAATGRSSGQRDANVVNGFGHGASPSVPLPGLGPFKQDFGAN
jgi:hypothetical protein